MLFNDRITQKRSYMEPSVECMYLSLNFKCGCYSAGTATKRTKFIYGLDENEPLELSNGQEHRIR